MEKLHFLSDRLIPAKLNRLQKWDRQPLKFCPIVHCQISVLVVTDYGGSFDSGGFGLESFLKAFDDPLPYTSFNITKANRRADASADIEHFRFDAHNLNEYDVILLFGIERPAFRPAAGANVVDEDELEAITRFMDQGGGMFATGDHEDLGVDMCGRIPRVRSMRRWYTAANPGPNGEPFAPPQGGGGEHNTIVNNGNQSDLFPQHITVSYNYGISHLGFQPHQIYQYVKYPHPVLCSPDGVIDVLPDHMHEGLCEVPNNLGMSFTFNGYTTQEYPRVNRVPLRPKLIAHAKNQNRNTRFGVIGVLDGHEHPKMGRVLVDATWHHFFNVNIDQWQDLKELVDGGHVPTPAEQTALEQYNLIQHYYRNIVYWLAPRNKQSCFRRRGWIFLLNHRDIAMSITTIPKKWTIYDRFRYWHLIGVLAKNALGDIQSACQTRALIPIFDKVLPTRRVPDFRSDEFSMFDPEVFETASMGSALHNLQYEMTRNKGELNDEQIDKIINKAVDEATSAVSYNAKLSASRFRNRIRKLIG